MKTFKDLEFKRKHPDAKWTDIFSTGYQALIKFDNGEDISVIFGYGAYATPKKPYEIYASCDSEPIGYLDAEEVTEHMKRIQSIKKEKNNENN